MVHLERLRRVRSYFYCQPEIRTNLTTGDTIRYGKGHKQIGVVQGRHVMEIDYKHLHRSEFTLKQTRAS